MGIRDILVGSAVAAVFTAAMFVGTAMGGDQVNHKEVKQDQKQLAQTRHTLDELSQHINLWHEANLLGDDRQISKHEKRLRAIIASDLAQSKKVAKQYRNKVARARNPKESHEYETEQAQAENLAKAKDRISDCLKRGKAFSNKYRLLGDYKDLLRRELGQERLHLAQDVRQARRGR